MPQVRVLSGEDAGKVVKIGREPLIIGRDPKCSIFLNDKGASRSHSEIFRVGEMCLIRDNDSRNGTYVNDDRIDEELLRDEDIIQIGSTTMIFESDEGPGKSKVTYESDREYRSTLELRLDDLFVATDSSRSGPYFRSMVQAAQILQEANNDQQSMEKMLDLIMEIIPSDNAYVFVRDPDTGAVTPRAWTERVGGAGIPVSRTILKKVIASGASIMSSDAMSDERFNAGESIMINQIKAVLCVPLTAQGDVFGAIYAVNQSEKENFEEEDLEILTGMGSLLAIFLSGTINLHRKNEQIMAVVASLLNVSSPDTPGVGAHAKRVGQFAQSIAEEIGMTANERQIAYLAGILHDIDAIFIRDGDTQSDLWESFLMQMSANPVSRDLAEILQSKDEYFNGTGTPNGLSKDDIPQIARIVSVAKILDKMLFENGQNRMSMKDALKQLDSQSGAVFDPEVVKHTVLAFRHGRLTGQKRGVARKKR